MSDTVPERTAGTSATAATGSQPAFPWLPPTWVLALGLVAVAANLRIGLAGLPPLVEAITTDLHLSNAAAGVLTTLPVLCMGVFAPVAHWASTRLGAAPTVYAAVALITVGSAMRLLGGNLALLYLASLLLGIGIAVAGVLLPRLVKTLFPASRTGLYTGIYMLAMTLGAAVSAALAVPLAEALGSWQGSLASWTVVGLVALVAWAPLTKAVWRRRAELTAQSVGARLPWRQRTAWLLAAFLAVQSWAFYSTLAWLSPSYVQLGWDREHAGFLLSVFSAIQIVSGVTMPILSDRVRDLRLLLVPATLSATLGVLGLVLTPDVGAWWWAALIGLGQGSGFAVALVLIVRVSATPHAAGGLTAMGFLIGYGAAAFGPLTMGAIRDVSGGFHAVWTVMLVPMAAQLLLAMALSPRLPKVVEP